MNSEVHRQPVEGGQDGCYVLQLKDEQQHSEAAGDVRGKTG